MSKLLTWNIPTWERKCQSLCQASLYWLGEKCGVGEPLLPSTSPENKIVPIHHFCFILFLPSSPYYFATHCSQKNRSRAAGFSLHQQIVPRDDGLRCIWHLLAIVDYMSTVCFLKEE